jgi:hypothetical protein
LPGNHSPAGGRDRCARGGAKQGATTFPCHSCTGTGLTPASSAPGPGSPLPHLRRDWAHPCLICTGTGRSPATSAPGLGSPLPHLHRDWAHQCGTGLTPATSAPGLGLPLPQLHRDWAHPCHICTGTALLQVHMRSWRPEGCGQGVRVVLARRRERYGGGVSLYHSHALLASGVSYRPSKRSMSRSARIALLHQHAVVA